MSDMDAGFDKAGCTHSTVNRWTNMCMNCGTYVLPTSHEGGEPAEQPAPGIDWNDDEAVVKAAVPDAWMNSIGCVWGTVGNDNHQSHLGNGWKHSRTNCAVQAYERTNRPAEARPASEPQGFEDGLFKAVQILKEYYEKHQMGVCAVIQSQWARGVFNGRQEAVNILESEIAALRGRG